MTIGEKIKNARNLRELTQKELGMKLGFDENQPMSELHNMKAAQERQSRNYCRR